MSDEEPEVPAPDSDLPPPDAEDAEDAADVSAPDEMAKAADAAADGDSEAAAGITTMSELAADPANDAVRADEELARELRRLSRRGFLVAGAAAAAGYAGWRWLRSRPPEAGVEWPLRRALEANESLAMAYFSARHLSPEFSRSQITRARINGGLGLAAANDPAQWRLRIEGAAAPVALTIEQLRAFPRREMITEFRCIEGWSTITQWAGVRLADVLTRFPPPPKTRFLAMETPDRGYYVGLDMASALHPQTLLAWEINGEPLSWQHGAPLRLVIPVKYGIKNIKRVGVIRYTDVRPADYWGDRGYDWYAGL
jgi:DMSO/TMAO reductase YedYZ molybdopterin-dependent catalytic subunit